MTEKLKQTTEQEVMKLPKEIQEAINVSGWVNTTEQISKKYLLNESQANDFQVQTLLVMVGLISEEDYVEGIEDELGITKDQAEKIANDSFEKIFEPLATTIEENIKKSLNSKDTTALQNINFILSGGNFGAFLESRDSRKSSGGSTAKLVGTSNIIETKNKLLN